MRHFEIIISFFLVLLTSIAQAQTPRTIRYDGRLERNGSPADGGYDLGFALFDAVDAGNQLWPSAQGTFATVRVTVSNGNFVVELGGQGMEALGWSVFAAPQVFVQTRVNGTSLNGRRVLGAVPFAVRADNGVPPGTIMAFAGTSLPEGWLWCDGAAYSTSGRYTQLFGAIGNGWGRPDAGTFNVPDLRGRFLRAVNDMGTGVAPNDGTRDPENRANGSVQRDGFRTHDHAIGNHQHHLRVAGETTTNGAHEHFYQGNEGSRVQGGNDNGIHFDFDSDQMATYGGGGHSHNVVVDGVTDASGGGTTGITGILETRPHNVAVSYIIKY